MRVKLDWRRLTLSLLGTHCLEARIFMRYLWWETCSEPSCRYAFTRSLYTLRRTTVVCCQGIGGVEETVTRDGAVAGGELEEGVRGVHRSKQGRGGPFTLFASRGSVVEGLQLFPGAARRLPCKSRTPKVLVRCMEAHSLDSNAGRAAESAAELVGDPTTISVKAFCLSSNPRACLCSNRGRGQRLLV